MLFTPSLDTIMDKLLSERTKRGRKKVYDTYKGMHELGHLDKQKFSLLHEVFSSEEAEKAYRDRGLQGLLIHMGYKAVNWRGMLTLVPPGGNAMDGWTFDPIALYEAQRKWRDEIMKNLEANHESGG